MILSTRTSVEVAEWYTTTLAGSSLRPEALEGEPPRVGPFPTTVAARLGALVPWAKFGRIWLHFGNIWLELNSFGRTYQNTSQNLSFSAGFSLVRQNTANFGPKLAQPGRDSARFCQVCQFQPNFTQTGQTRASFARNRPTCGQLLQKSANSGPSSAGHVQIWRDTGGSAVGM